MAYSESKELTDTEKRLQALKTQLFGKEKVKATKKSSYQTSAIHNTGVISTTQHEHQDLAYLKKDLLKITMLATIALFVQLIIYMQLTLKILKFS
ncbi:MAG: hypothetical protein PHQ59_02020 [Candidatus Daviesbacteria bacterium]|nr:hypothetical protein [Candidatus Daviesbacteria bacterium]